VEKIATLKKILISLSILLLYGALSFAQSEATVNYYQADSILHKILKKYNAYFSYNKPVEFYFEGKEFTTGHFPVPNQYDTANIKCTITSLNNKDELIHLETSEVTVKYHAYNLFSEDASSSTYYNDSVPKRKNKDLLQFPYMYLPYKALQLLLENKNSLHCIKSKIINILGFNDKSGNKYYLYADSKNQEIKKIERLEHDEIYGDVVQEIIYSNYKTIKGLPIPSQILHKKNNFPQRVFNYKSLNINPTIDTILIKKYDPLYFSSQILEQTQTAYELDTIAPGLYILKLKLLNNKVLVAEYKDFLSIIEAPQNLETGRSIIKYLNEKFPTKKIKYCFVSHHHPDHAGAITAFMENNSTIISTNKSINFFKTISKGKSTRILNNNDLVISNKVSYHIIDADSNKTFFSKEYPLKVYERGKSTFHTNEYLFFYFPVQKILFVGDLVYFSATGVIPQSKRAYSLFKLITEENILVNRIYTSFPLNGVKEYGTFEDLKAALKQNYPEINSKITTNGIITAH
jgi:hypothetical protein